MKKENVFFWGWGWFFVFTEVSINGKICGEILEQFCKFQKFTVQKWFRNGLLYFFLFYCVDFKRKTQQKHNIVKLVAVFE